MLQCLSVTVVTDFVIRVNASYFGTIEVWGYLLIAMRQVSEKVLFYTLVRFHAKKPNLKFCC